MNDPVLHYLIIFNHKKRAREIIEFGQDIDLALEAYAQKEEEYSEDRSMEVVLVGSDSIESVKATHSKYFPERCLTNGWLTDLERGILESSGRRDYLLAAEG